MTSSTNIASWHLLPTTANIRGNKSAAITGKYSEVVKVILEQTYAPYGASSFEKTAETVRLNLDIACSESHNKFFNEVDAWVVAQMENDPQSYFKKKMSKSEILAIFKPSCTPHSKDGVDYAPTARTKINTAGPKMVQCWSVDKNARPPPSDYRNCKLTVEVTVRGIWFMSGQCGVTYEAQNIIVEEHDHECPF